MAKATASIEELFDLARGRLQLGIERPNIYGYTPYPEQLEFHQCEKVGRYLAGGNRGGKCLVAGTLVQMADGQVKAIEDIEVGEHVIAPSGRPTRVVAVWDKGLQPVNRYRIGRYRDVVEVVTTENHKFWGARESHGKLGEFERRPIKDLLRKGDKIMRSQGTQLNGIREERAYVLGLMLGDGHFGPRWGSNLQFTCADPELAEAFADVFVPRQTPIQYGFHNGQAWHDWFTSLGLADTRSHTKFIPLEVWGWDEASIAEVIAGLAVTDGSWWVSSKGEHRFEFVSASRQLIEDFRRLAGVRLGIWGSTITEGSKGTYCISYSTREALEKLAALPIRGRKAALARTAVPIRNSRSSYVSVKEFTDEGWQQCYDISVEDETHCFMLANGLFTSNTDAMVAEMVFWATDTHPWQQRPGEWGSGSLQLRCFVVDVEKGVNQILLPKLKRYIPSSYLVDGDFDKSWNQKSLILTLENGTTIDFLTYGMGLEKMGGVPRHIIFFDEEPPQAIFTESLMRLIDFKGRWVIAATPVQGIGWTFDHLWEPGRTDPANPITPGTFTLSASKNPFLKTSEEDFGVYSVGMDEEERKMRFEGEFVARSGLIFPEFDADTHCVDLEAYFPYGRIPKDWRIYSSVDHGLNNPTAWLWHAVSPQGDIVTFSEHYKSNMLIEEHAEVVHAREREFGRVPEFRTGDPAMRQRNAVTGTNILQEYSRHGIFIGIEGVPHEVEIGLGIMRTYFKPRDTGSFWGHGRPKWVIAYVCPNFIKEMKKLRYASYDSQKAAYDKNKQEIVHKKDDHAFDSARYFATLMPTLAPPDPYASDRSHTYGSRSYAEVMAEVADRKQQQWSVEEAGDDWY